MKTPVIGSTWNLPEYAPERPLVIGLVASVIPERQTLIEAQKRSAAATLRYRSVELKANTRSFDNMEARKRYAGRQLWATITSFFRRSK